MRGVLVDRCASIGELAAISTKVVKTRRKSFKAVRSGGGGKTLAPVGESEKDGGGSGLVRTTSDVYSDVVCCAVERL